MTPARTRALLALAEDFLAADPYTDTDYYPRLDAFLLALGEDRAAYDPETGFAPTVAALCRRLLVLEARCPDPPPPARGSLDEWLAAAREAAARGELVTIPPALAPRILAPR